VIRRLKGEKALDNKNQYKIPPEEETTSKPSDDLVAIKVYIELGSWEKLCKLGEKAVEPLISALIHFPPASPLPSYDGRSKTESGLNVHQGIIETLAKIGGERAIEGLITALGDERVIDFWQLTDDWFGYSRVCRYAKEALKSMGKDAIDPLRAALSKVDTSNRKETKVAKRIQELLGLGKYKEDDCIIFGSL